MSTRKKDRSYKPLGTLLESWRNPRYRSSLALFRAQKFSFSYNTYTDYEKGALLPSVEQILELATTFQEDPRPALLLWAEVQMPTAELQSIFHTKSPATLTTTHTPYKTPFQKMKAPHLENTWVFGSQEKKFMEKNPWFFELCLKLCLTYPDVVSYQELEFHTEDAFQKFLKKYLKPWVQQGRFETPENKGLKITYPHLHLPKSEDWAKLRLESFLRVSETLARGLSAQDLNAQKGYRELITRNLTNAQVEKWVIALQKLEGDFKDDSYIDDPKHPTTTYTLALAFGPRPLKLPKN